MSNSQIENEELDNTRYIAEQIFSQPPRPPKTIQLQLEEQTADLGIKSTEGIQVFIYKIVGLITYHGVEILYGHKDLSLLTEKEYIRIREYVNSFGYDIIKDTGPNGELLIGFKNL